VPVAAPTATWLGFPAVPREASTKSFASAPCPRSAMLEVLVVRVEVMCDALSGLTFLEHAGFLEEVPNRTN